MSLFTTKPQKEAEPNPLYSTIPKSSGIAPVVGGLKATSDSSYLQGLTATSNPNDVKAANQGFWSEMGNSLAQTGSEATLGALEGTGYLLQGLGIIQKSEDGFANDLSNWANEVNTKFNQEVVPVYNSEQYSSPSEWFFENMQSIASAVSLMVPAMGATMGASKLAGATARVIGGSKIMKAAGIMKGSELAGAVGGGLETLTMAATSRHMENMMEGKEQYDRVYEEALGKGFSEEAAKKAAIDAGKLTYSKNWNLLLTDMLQYGMVLRTFGQASKAASIGEIAKRSGATAKSILSQSGLEAAEEGYQFISGEESARQAKIENGIDKEDYSVYSERLLDYVSDGDFWNSAFFGALGGAVFDIAGNKVQDWERAKFEEQTKVVKDDLRQAIAVYEKDPKKFREAQDSQIHSLMAKGISSGRADQVESMLNIMGENQDPNLTPEDLQAQKLKAKQYSADFVEFQQVYNDSKKVNTEEVSRMILANRMQYKSTSRSVGESQNTVTKKLDTIATENKLDSNYTKIFELSAKNAVLENLLADENLKVDKGLIKEKISNVQKLISQLRDTTKTNLGITDADIDSKIGSVDASAFMPTMIDATLGEVKLDQLTKDYNEVNTPKGKERLDKEIQDYKQKKDEDYFNNLLKSITPSTDSLQLVKIKEQANNLGKVKEYEAQYNKVLSNEKFSAAKFNTTDPETSLRGRWEGKTLLKDHEIKNINSILLKSGGIPTGVILDEKTIGEIYVTNPVFKQNLDTYFKNSNSITIPTVSKQTIKPSGSESDGNPKENEIVKDKESLNPNQQFAWKTQGYQFKYNTKDKKFEKDAEGKLIPNDASLATKIDWSLVNSGKLPIGATLHYEYDFNEPYNELAKAENALIELAYYKDGDTENKLDNNRSVVGVLTAFANDRDFGNIEDKNALKKLREKLYKEVQEAPLRKGYVTLTPITKVESYFAGGGQFHNTGTLNNPIDVLRAGEEFVIGIGQQINKVNLINLNNHPLQDRLTTQNGEPGFAYVMLTDNNGAIRPAKAFVPFVKEFPEVQKSVTSLLQALKDAPTIEQNRSLVKEISELASIRSASFNTGTYTIGLGSDFAPTTVTATDATLDEVVGNLMLQVDLTRINRGTYNKDLAERGWIKLDIMPVQYFHSTSIVTEPYKEETISKKELAVETKPIDFNKSKTDYRYEASIIANLTNSQRFETEPELAVYVTNILKLPHLVTSLKDIKEANEKYIASLLKKPAKKIEGLGSTNIDLGTPGSKFKVVEETSFETINEVEVRTWFTKNLPQLSPDFVDGLIEVRKNGGAKAWGIFKNKLITLSKAAPKGTEHHEAFHAVFNLFLTKAQQEEILDEASIKYDLPRSYDNNPLSSEKYNLLSDDELENILKKRFYSLSFYTELKDIITKFQQDKILDNFIGIPFYIRNAPKEIKRKYDVLGEDILSEEKETDSSGYIGFLIEYENGEFNLYTSSNFDMIRSWGIGNINKSKVDITSEEIKELLAYGEPSNYVIDRWNNINIAIREELTSGRNKITDSNLIEKIDFNKEGFSTKDASYVIRNNKYYKSIPTNFEKTDWKETEITKKEWDNSLSSYLKDNPKAAYRLLSSTYNTFDLVLEELLADELMRHIREDNDKTSLPDKIKKFFNKIKETIKAIFSNDITIDSLMFRINTGFYNKAIPLNETNEVKYRVSDDPITAKKRTNAINYQLFKQIDIIRSSNPAYADSSDISILKSISETGLGNTEALYRIYGRIYNGFVDLHDSLPDTDSRKVKIANIVDQFFKYDENGDVLLNEGYFGKAVNDLSKYGILIKEKEIKNSYDDISNEDYFKDEDETQSQSFDRTAIQNNPKDTLSYKVRKMLRQTERWAYNKESNTFEVGTPQTNDDLGFQSYVDFDELENYLRTELSDLQDVDDMLLKLGEMQYTRPEVHGIIEKLEKDNVLLSSFFSNFSGAYLPYIQVSKELKRKLDRSVGDYYTETQYKVFNANRHNIRQLIVDEWNSNLQNSSLNEITDKEGNVDMNLAKVHKESYDNIVKEFTRSKKMTPEIAVKLNSNLLKFGMTINPQVFTNEFDAKVRDSKRKVITPYEKMYQMLMGKNSINIILNSFTQGLNPYEGDTVEASSIQNISSIVGRNEAQLHQDSIINIEGKSVYSYTLPTFFTKKLQELKTEEGRARYINDWWFSKSKWLQDLNDPNDTSLRDNFNVAIFDGASFNEYKSGTKYFDMTDRELSVSDINLFENGNKSWAWYRLPLLSDGSNAAIVRFKKYTTPEVIDGLYEVALGEAQRIERLASTPTNIANYDINGSKYQMITVFNNTDIDVNNQAQAKEEIKKWLENQFEIEKRRLQDLGILKSDSGFSTDNKGHLQDVDSRRNGSKAAQDKLLSDYFYNKVFSNVNLIMLTSVDPSFYKSAPNDNPAFGGNPYKDFMKRNGQVFKFTQSINTKALWNGTTPGETYTGVYIKDNYISSKELQVATVKALKAEGYTEDEAKTVGSLYLKVNQTDAQTYITIDRRKKIMIGLGEWNDKLESAYKKIKKDKASPDEFNLFLQPIKPFYFDHIEVDGITTPTQHKNSEVVLLPMLAKHNPKLRKLLDFMEKNNVDSALFTSAVKSGINGEVESTDIENAKIHIFNNKYWGISQVVPVHHIETENKFGTQLRKLIFNDLADDVKILGRNKKQIFELYQKLITDNLTESYNVVAGEFESIESIQKILLDQIRQRNLGDAYEKAVELVVNTKGEKVFNIPLFDPIHSRRMQNILNAIIRNNVFEQKINGGTFVLMSNFGFSEDLKVLYNEKTGAVEGMEMLLPSWARDKFPRKPNGEVDLEYIKEQAPELLEMFGYRIPTEHFYSMKKLIVKGFTPDIMGGVAVLPAEITTIAGEDFDIDKLYVMIPNWEVTDGKLSKVKYDLNAKNLTKAQRDNAIIDIISAIWSHPNTAVNILNPGGFERLKKLNEKVVSRTGGLTTDLNPIFPINEMNFFNNFTNGATLIGIAANHNTHHAISQYSELGIAKSFKFDNKTSSSLNKIKTFGDRYISRSLAEFIAAFVDNAKDPVANTLNLNTYTFDTVALLARLGFELDTVIYFINQPVIRELVKRYNNYGRTREAERTAIAEIRQYLLEVLPELPKDGIYPLKTSELEASLYTDLVGLPTYMVREQAVVLTTFLQAKGYAKSLSTLVKASKVDTTGTGKTMADNNYYLNLFKQVGEDQKLVNTDSVFKIPLISASNNILYKSQSNLLGKYFPYDGDLFRDLLITATKNKGEDITQQEANFLYNQFIHHYVSSFDVFEEKDRKAFVTQFPSKKFVEYAADKDLKEFALMKYLRYVPETPENKVGRVEFASNSTLTSDQREIISASWKAMLGSDNIKVKKAATDLVKYAFYTTYFGYTFKGFSQLLPIEYLENMVDQNGVSYRDYIYKLLDEKHSKHYIANYLDQVYRHQDKDVTLLKTLRKEDISKFSKPVKGIVGSLSFDSSKSTELELIDKEGKLNVRYLRLRNRNGIYHAYRFEGFSAEGHLVYNIRENLGYGKDILEFSKDQEVYTVLPFNKLPILTDADFLESSERESEEFLQLEDGKEKDKANKELNDILKGWASSLGVTVEQHTDSMNRMSKDAKGMADLYKKTILVSQEKETIDTLPEEIGHFAEAYSRGHAFHDRLMEIIEFTPTYTEVLAKYGDLYSNDITKLKQETIGKLIGEAIVKRYEETRGGTSNVVMQFLQGVWNRFVSLFRRANVEDLQSEINKITEYVADQVLANDITQFEEASSVKISGEFYSIGDELDIKNEKKVLEDAVNSIYKKVEIYEKRASKTYSEQEKKVLDKLLTDFNDANYNLGLIKYVANARIELKKVAARYNTIKSADPKTIEERKELIKTLRNAQNYVSGFKTTINEIKELSPFSKSVNDKVAVTSAVIENLEKDYLNIGKVLLTQVFNEFSTHPELDVKKALTILEKDVSYTQRHLDSMAEASDPILKIIDKIVKDSIQRNRMKMLDQSKDLIDAQKELEKDGIPSTNWIFERDFQGNLTGRYISEYNWGEYNKARNRFFENNPKPTRDQYLGKQEEFETALKNWNIAVAIWFESNTQVNPQAKELIEKKRVQLVEEFGARLGTEKFNDWIQQNTREVFDPATHEFYTKYVKELSLPANKYKSKQYEEVLQNSAMKNYYDKAINTLKHMEEQLPEIYRLHGLMPQTRKDFFERLGYIDKDGKKRLRSAKDTIREGRETLSELIVKKEDDIEFGLTDENGNPINYVPVFFIKKLDDMRNLSLDATSSIIAYLNSAYNYKAMEDVVHTAELTKDVIAERAVLQGTFDPVVLLSSDFINSKGKEVKVRKVTIEGDKSKAYSRLVDYINMVVYGQQKKDESFAKIVDTLNAYTSLNSLALNLYSGVSNITFGNLMTRMEAFAGEMIDHKSLLQADKTYTSELPNVLADVGQRNASSKLGLWVELMDTFQDYNRELNNADAGRNTVFSRLFKQSSLYFVNKAGEHLIQSRLSLALANRIQVKDKEGNVLSLWDAYEKVNVGTEKSPSYRLRLREGLTKVGSTKEGDLFKKEEDSQALTEKDIVRFINRQNFLNKRLNGIYNNVDKSAVQQYAVGRLAIMFRKFLKPGWNRRFEKLTYNEEGEIYTEGYYTTTWNFMKVLAKDLRQSNFQVGSRWNELTEREKRNLIRTLTEASFMLGTAILASALTNMSDDDDDNQLLAFAAYEAYRTHSELSAYLNYQEGMRILKSPAAAVHQINNLTRLVAFWEWAKPVEKGKYKGLNRFEVSAVETIPLMRTYYNFKTPDEQLKFFSNNPPVTVSMVDEVYK